MNATKTDAGTAKLTPYVSTMAKRFSPGNFVTSDRRMGVTRAIEDVQEANPLVLVKWMDDLSEEWIRSEYIDCAALTSSGAS